MMQLYKGGSDFVLEVCARGVRLNRPPHNILYELMNCDLVLMDNNNLSVCVCV